MRLKASQCEIEAVLRVKLSLTTGLNIAHSVGILEESDR